MQVYLRRTASAHLNIYGREIAAGDPVTGFVASADFDPSEFSEPLDLDLIRRPNRHLWVACHVRTWHACFFSGRLGQRPRSGERGVNDLVRH
jgi:cytochrome P450